MLRTFANDQQRDLLHSMSCGTLSMADVYQRWSNGDLKEFQAEREAAANDPDLEPYVERWNAILVNGGHKSADKYLSQLRTLITAGSPFLRSAFRRAAIRTWLDGRPAKSRNREMSSGFSGTPLVFALPEAGRTRDTLQSRAHEHCD
ncbi:MAG: hypothetical protein H7Z40_20300 [Phycisphaerae bacterium]|nr:hypothetical protein [Gemmatimonadaceae bacterium]